MKNNLKRLFSLMLAVVLLVTLLPMDIASAKTFKDVPSKHWAYNFINEMSNNGYINGYPDGTFKPNSNIKFLEAMKFSARLTKADSSLIEQARSLYKNDVVSSGVPTWAQEDVIKCLANNVITVKTLKAAKKAKMFSKNAPGVSRVNLAEYFAKAMNLNLTKPVIALPYKDVASIDQKYRVYVDALIDAGVLSKEGNGKGYFYPKQAVSRAQVAKMVHTALKYQQTNTATPVNPVNPVNPINPVNPVATVVTGKVKLVQNAGYITFLSVTDMSGMDKLFTINTTTRVSVDGSLSTIDKLMAGQNVTVTANGVSQGAVATSVDAKGVQYNIEGEVTNVDNSNKEIKISYTDDSKNKTARVFKVDSNSTITISGRTRDLYDVKNGAKVKATIYNDTIKSLEVTSSSDDYKGYITRLNTREITITSLNGRENIYNLPSRESDMDIYDSRNVNRSRSRKVSLSELQTMVNTGSVYVEIETDPRYNEVSYIEILDGFDNEYIVYSNNGRGRNSDQYEIVLYSKGSNSYRDRETYYYDRDLRADSLTDRRDIRVRDIGEGSRVVILEKDKDVIKRLMVIDTKDNRGYYYGNWVRARVNYKKSDAIGIKEYNSDREYEVKVSSSIDISKFDYTTYYYLEIINNTVRSYSIKEPDDYRRSGSRYDKTIIVDSIYYNSNREKLYLWDKDNNDYTIDRYTTISGYYSSFNELSRENGSYVNGLKADITVGSNKVITSIYFYR